ncbi:hypothetical protein Taro_031218 [Colocasia esculenta]|uniref:Uncharacterized protein n=1 Tax=Colocasia esculenta TaxID=4460 RepID=A0A843VID0_COLES|nr:hypothetical protein [Colocasia esculenta]
MPCVPALAEGICCGYHDMSLGSVRGGTGVCSSLTSWRVASFPAGSECELQESVANVAGCACYERGCWFARAAVGFVVGMRIRVGLSRRLREPMCGVAFTVGVFARAKQMLVLPGFFSVGSSGVRVPLSGAAYVLVEVYRLVSLVVLVEVLPGPACVASTVLLAAVFSLMDFVCPRGRVICLASRALRTLCDGGLEEAGCVPSSSAFRGCSGWWCSAMEVGAVFRTVATFAVKVPPLELS